MHFACMQVTCVRVSAKLAMGAGRAGLRKAVDRLMMVSARPRLNIEGILGMKDAEEGVCQWSLKSGGGF